MESDQIEVSVVQDFWEEHIEKSQDNYNPYHYVDDMNTNGEDILIEFDWEEYE